MRPARSSSCYRHSTASAAKVASRLSASSTFTFIQAARPSSATCKAGDTAAVTKPAPPLAIGQEQSGITLDDLIGKQPELVGREGV